MKSMRSLACAMALRVMALCVVMTVAASARAEVRLPAIFSDHMVLQREIPVAVWGWAEAGEKVTVSIGNSMATATADAAGKWSVKLDKLAAGQGLTLIAKGTKNAATVQDVLVGEVWLCSGQSNMGMTVPVDTYPDEVAAANRPTMRYYRTPNKASLKPLDDSKGAWELCTPQTVKNWSGAAYFFGQTLQNELNCPIGLIYSAWGGTQAESWISREALLAQPQLKELAEEQIAAMERFDADARKFADDLAAWQQENGAADPGNKGATAGWQKPEFDDTGWKPVKSPLALRDLGLKGGGIVWMRKAFDLAAGAAGKDVRLEIGYSTLTFNVYVNGTECNVSWNKTPPFYNRNVAFDVPGKLLKAGRNVIAVRMHALDETNSLPKDVKSLRLPAADLADNQWRAQVEAAFPALPAEARKSLPKAPAATMHNTAGTLYNGMIEPLRPYAIRGAIWYQGESNAGRGAQYELALTTLINDWRVRWQQGDFAFYTVQLANYGKVPTDASAQSGWALVREGQLRASQKVANSGLAVAIDIGQGDDVHPKNKRDVGRRLAFNALAKTYGKAVEFAGPTYESMAVEGGAVRLKFSHAAGLAAKGGTLRQFAIAGEDKKFVWADARVDGQTVLVSSPQVARPVAVRYAWSDNPEGCNLYNGAGLPASPFRTDDWK